VSTPVAIGIDIGGTQLRAAVVAADGSLADRTSQPTPADDETLLVATIREVIEALGADLPVGIGIAGLVSPSGVVRYGPNIGVRDLPLAASLADATSGPVVVINDASAAAFGEQQAGAARGRRDMLLFTLGTGVGGGIVVDGRLLVGSRGFAGELGHIVVAEGGRRCPCGSRGCIEAYASGTAITLLARERLVDPTQATVLRDHPVLTGPLVTQAARQGDAFAADVLREVGHWLGVAIASMANALDPEIVLLGGGAAAATADWVLPEARRAGQSHLVGGRWRSLPPIELAALGDDAGMIGAGLHAAGAYATGGHAMVPDRADPDATGPDARDPQVDG
jgi:glucokinase